MGKKRKKKKNKKTHEQKKASIRLHWALKLGLVARVFRDRTKYTRKKKHKNKEDE